MHAKHYCRSASNHCVILTLQNVLDQIEETLALTVIKHILHLLLGANSVCEQATIPQHVYSYPLAKTSPYLFCLLDPLGI